VTARRRAATARTADAGAAVVEFVLISVLLVMLLFAVLQLAVYVYARNIVAAAAADAAEYAARAGADPVLATGRARSLIAAGLNAADAAALPCAAAVGVDAVSGLPTTTVRCTGELPLLFSPLHLTLRIDVRSSALREGVP
jgi:Flp pilus assembly protein TadG